MKNTKNKHDAVINNTARCDCLVRKSSNNTDYPDTFGSDQLQQKSMEFISLTKVFINVQGVALKEY